MSQGTIDAKKDPRTQHPIATSWRPTLSKVVASLAAGDYRIQGIPSVDVADSTASQMEEYVADYGETLVDLPDETWNTSVAQWMGTYWDALVDLWTAESGKSDLVLGVRVFETAEGVHFEVTGLYVP